MKPEYEILVYMPLFRR